MPFPIPRLYAIIDPARTGRLPSVEVAAILLQAGVRLIQYRDKLGTSRELFETSMLIADCVRKAGGLLILNDRADIARVSGAHGVHVGQDDLPVEWARNILGIGRVPVQAPEPIVGCSTHNLAQLRQADATSADYIAFGPIFETQSKANADPAVGLEGLREARKLTRKPLVAIGGITLPTVGAVIEAGADSVAVIGDLFQGSNIGARAREFLKTIGAETDT